MRGLRKLIIQAKSIVAFIYMQATKAEICHPERVKRAEGSLLCIFFQNVYPYLFSARILRRQACSE